MLLSVVRIIMDLIAKGTNLSFLRGKILLENSIRPVIESLQAVENP